MNKPESVKEEVYKTVKSEQRHEPLSATDAQYGANSVMRSLGFQTKSEEEMYDLGIDLGKTVLHLSRGDPDAADNAYQSAKRYLKRHSNQFDDPAWMIGESYTLEDAVGALEEAEDKVMNEAEDLNLEYYWGHSVDEMAL
ncbi:MAG: hypothetical protein R6V35_03350 [Candidatus Nanohaloarchaea archaeon]